MVPPFPTARQAPAPARPSCPRCRWPKVRCFCDSIRPLATRSRFVLLMHPHEARHERTGTGRLCHLALAESEIIVGERFDGDARLASLLADPAFQPALLWPDASAQPLDGAGLAAPADPACPVPPARRPLFLILDGSWSQARSMFRDSPCLHPLPRVRLSDAPPSGWRFKRQPAAHCLSTLETIHQLLLDLRAAGLDRYDDPALLPSLFGRLQEAQTRLGPAKAAHPV